MKLAYLRSVAALKSCISYLRSKLSGPTAPISPVGALPSDFNWEEYLGLHEDLRSTGIDCEKKAIAHYLNHGALEGRRYKRIVTVVKDGSTNPRSGVNVLGFVNSELGLGVACRTLIKSLDKQGIPHKINELPSSNISGSYYRPDDESLYETNIICCNPDLDFLVLTGEEYVRDKTNIGLWFWELGTLPDKWKQAAAIYNEIWVNSRFCEDTLTRELPGTRVRYIKPEIAVPEARDIGVCKDYFGIARQTMVFLFVFDGNSDYFRKNPDGVIKAFSRAFSKESNVSLVIKTHNMENEYIQKLHELIGEDTRIQIYQDSFSAKDINTLMNACDVYVSLHRSEGLGLTILDAVLLEKPVICTGWSGNTDFFQDTYSGLVNYELVDVVDASRYRKFFPSGTVVQWAEPDISTAAEKMNECHANIAIKIKEVREVKSQLLGLFSGNDYREILGNYLDD